MAAPSGGGGGGGPVGFANSFTGPAESLELVGDHCFAYSGEKVADTSATNFLKFTTGNYYTVANIQFNYPRDNSDDAIYEVLMNGTVVQKWLNTGAQNPNQPQNVVPIVIPHYTEVIVRATVASTGRYQIVSITGRIYR